MEKGVIPRLETINGVPRLAIEFLSSISPSETDVNLLKTIC